MDIGTLRTRFCGQCFYCFIEVAVRDLSGGKRMLHDHATRDHYIPKCRLKPGEPARLVLACHWCNNRKGDMPASDFLQSNLLRARRIEVRGIMAKRKPHWRPFPVEYVPTPATQPHLGSIEAAPP